MARRLAIIKKKALAAAASLVTLATTTYLNHRRFRSCYVRPINCLRKEKGEFHVLVSDLRQLDEERPRVYFRMTKEQFDKLLEMVELRLIHPKNHLMTSALLMLFTANFRKVLFL